MYKNILLLVITTVPTSITSMHFTDDIEQMANITTAIEEGDINAVQQYLTNGYDANAQILDTSLLVWAIENNNMYITRMLIDNGASVHTTHDILDRSPLQCAIDAYNDNAVTLLIEKNVDINAPSNIVQRPVMHAAQIGNYLAVKTLINHGAHITGTDHHGNTILHHSMQWKSFNELIPYFIAHITPHIDSTSRNNAQQTPVMIARANNNQTGAQIMQNTFHIQNILTPDQQDQPRTHQSADLRKRLMKRLHHVAHKKSPKGYSSLAQRWSVRKKILPLHNTHHILEYINGNYII